MNTLYISAAASFFSGLLFVYIGRVLAQRKLRGDAKLASSLFVVWWYGLGISSVTSGVTVLLYTMDRLKPQVYDLIVQAQVFLILVALLGLLYYLVYLYTGSRQWLTYLIGFYVFLYFWFVWIIGSGGPTQSLADNGWAVEADEAPEYSRGFGALLVLALIGPQIAACIAYLRLYPKAQTVTQRYRILLVAGAIIIWFGSSVVGSVLEVSGDAWQVFSKLLAVTSSVTMLLAYKPPSKWQSRYGLETI